MRIEHANITVSDVQASAAFYRRLFDAALRWEGATEAGLRAAHIGDDEAYLALFEATQQGRAPASYFEVGFNHVAFQVDDLDTYRQRLAQMGVPIKAEEDYEPGRRLYFYDPDGVEIELVEY